MKAQTAKNPIKFISPEKSLFFPTLKKRVDQYFTQNNLSRHANSTMIIKSTVFIGGYILPFIALLVFHPALGPSLALWAIMGFCLAGIGMSVMHDANHNAYSSSDKINYLMGHSLNLIGGSVFNWKLQHNVLHHMYTNIATVDEDIQDRLVLRFSPHTKVKFFHQLQWIYAFVFYGLLTFYWVLAKDLIQYRLFIKNGTNTNSKKENNVMLTKMIALKVIYFFIMLIIPVAFLNFTFAEILLGFFLMHFISGIVLTVVFQLAHTVEGTDHPLPNEKNVIENDWAIHQMNTTVNFARNNKFLSWYVGGLNFQVEHHLFPRVCHVHYPQIAEIVKATAEEFNIPYMENKTFGKAIKSHINTLHRFGRLPAWNEAIG
jgi:linoleoyl-CoA desaturase